MSPIQTAKETNFRWTVCGMLFFATMINYMDRQVLSLTWQDFIAPEFAWSDEDYSQIISLFSLAYAISMLFVGKLTDIVGAKKGYTLAMAVWSFGAILHAFCGIATCAQLTGELFVSFDGAKEKLHDYGVTGLLITTISVGCFCFCRLIMAIGQAGNFPAAVVVTAEYFPKKDRTYAISIFNNGASVGALISPLLIPVIAENLGWEMAFFLVGALGYIWMFLWIKYYVKARKNPRVNQAEYDYIMQDEDLANNILQDNIDRNKPQQEQKSIGLIKCFTYPRIWGLILGKFMTDGAWWFFLFWTPVYISEFYGYTSYSATGIALMTMLYIITMLSIGGAYIPTYLVNKYGMSATTSHSRAMLIFALVQLIGILAVPLGSISPWLFIIVVGLLGASHQSWSACMFSMVGDYFPKNTIGTVTGIIGMAGGIASFILMESSGKLFTYASNMGEAFAFVSYTGKQAAYMIVFCCIAVMYLGGWGLMRITQPKQDI